MTVSAQAPKLPCDARTLRRLRNSVAALPQTVLADGPSASCASRRPQRGPAPIPCREILPISYIRVRHSDINAIKTDIFPFHGGFSGAPEASPSSTATRVAVGKRPVIECNRTTVLSVCWRSIFRGAAFHGLLVPSACLVFARRTNKLAGFPPFMVARIGRTRPCYAAKLSPDITLGNTTWLRRSTLHSPWLQYRALDLVISHLSSAAGSSVQQCMIFRSG